MRQIRDWTRSEGLDLPLFLHAGESSLPSTTRAMPCELGASCGLAINSLVHSALPEPEKGKMLIAWQEAWSDFVSDVSGDSMP